MAKPQQRTLWQRIPWLWYDYVVARSRLPLWLLSLIPFAINYSIGILAAIVAGELPQFLRDWRWLASSSAGLSAVILGYTPQTLSLLWARICPWLANSEEEIAALQMAAPQLLMRFFWITALLSSTFFLPWAFLGPELGNWAYDYTHPESFKLMMLPIGIINAYFFGGALCIAAVGIWLFAQRIGQVLNFKRGFLLQGSKAALQPFNQLLWVMWGIALYGVVDMGLILAFGGAPQLYNIFLLLSIGLLSVPSIVLPQYFMNRLLAREKAEELKALQGELAEAASLPDTADTSEILRCMHRHQHLVYQIQQVQSFTPTLVDARFVIQIATSVTAIIAAQFLLRTVLAGVL